MYTSVNAVTQACMSFTSQNYGAGQWKRMGKVLRHCLFLTTAVSLMLGSVIYSFGPEILKLYTEEPDVIASAMEVLSYTTLTYFMCGIMDLFPGALRGMGFSAAPMVLSIIGTVGTRLVWIYGIFPMHRALSVLFVSYPVSWLLTIVMQVTCYLILKKKLFGEIAPAGK